MDWLLTSDWAAWLGLGLAALLIAAPCVVAWRHMDELPPLGSGSVQHNHYGDEDLR